MLALDIPYVLLAAEPSITYGVCDQTAQSPHICMTVGMKTISVAMSGG